MSGEGTSWVIGIEGFGGKKEALARSITLEEIQVKPAHLMAWGAQRLWVLLGREIVTD